MPASEEAYGEGHPATYDEYVDDDGHKVQREKNKAAIRAQLSELAMGEGDETVRSFEQPPRVDSNHDHGPDN